MTVESVIGMIVGFLMLAQNKQAIDFAKMACALVGKTADDLMAAAYQSAQYQDWARGRLDIGAILATHAQSYALLDALVLADLVKQADGNAAAIEHAVQMFRDWQVGKIDGRGVKVTPIANGSRGNTSGGVTRSTQKTHSNPDGANVTLKAQDGQLPNGKGRGGNHYVVNQTYQCRTGMNSGCGLTGFNLEWVVFFADIPGCEMLLPLVQVNGTNGITVDIGATHSIAKGFWGWVITSCLPVDDPRVESWLNRITKGTLPDVKWSKDLTNDEMVKYASQVKVNDWNGYRELGADRRVLNYYTGTELAPDDTNRDRFVLP